MNLRNIHLIMNIQLYPHTKLDGLIIRYVVPLQSLSWHCYSHETLFLAPIAVVSEEGDWPWQSPVFTYQPPEIQTINLSSGVLAMD